MSNYDNNPRIRAAVNRLTELLEWLYPNPSPDIFTVRDYRNRYPFTRLGPLAVADIDRYKRINFAFGNQDQIGLYDYHIGLIYLHEGVFHGAVQQFEMARQQWSFVNQSAAVALTHLARAVALQLADHYEAALISVGRVARWLERSHLAKPILGWQEFEAQVLAYVAQLQAQLRQQMEAGPETGVDTPLPIDNMSPTIPVLGHRLLEERYEWYRVEVRPSSDFMPEINPGDWLLVDLQPRLTKNLKDTEQPILVVKKEEIDGTIRVRPLESRERYQRIYLVTLADSPTGSFWVDEATGTVTFSSEMAEIGINRNEILGVVVGFWRPMVNVLPIG